MYFFTNYFTYINALQIDLLTIPVRTSNTREEPVRPPAIHQPIPSVTNERKGVNQTYTFRLGLIPNANGLLIERICGGQNLI